MVYDLFTSADYCYSKFSYFKMLVWIIGLLWLFWGVNLYFFSGSRLSSLLSNVMNWHFVKVNSPSLGGIKGSYSLMSALFLMILGSNVWGLFPYVFGMTTQMVVTFSMSLMIWVSMVMSSVEFSMGGFLCHLTPQGAPMYLAPVLNLMELVSNIIRPLTLALRLSMNMTTGHVLMALMSTSGVLSLLTFKMIWLVLAFIMTGYFLFEMGMCFMQGFVFSLLSVQYLEEHT